MQINVAHNCLHTMLPCAQNMHPMGETCDELLMNPECLPETAPCQASIIQKKNIRMHVVLDMFNVHKELMKPNDRSNTWFRVSLKVS